jgi:hypothetical protein
MPSNPIRALTIGVGDSLRILEIAHKYCMDAVEEDIISILKADRTTDGLVHALAASQIIGDKGLYDQSIQALIATKPLLSMEQAKLVGLEGIYAIYVSPAALPCGCAAQYRAGRCNFCGYQF